MGQAQRRGQIWVCRNGTRGHWRMDGSSQAAEAMSIDWFREQKIVKLIERNAVWQYYCEPLSA